MEKKIKSTVDSYLYSWEYAVIRGEQAYYNVIQDKYEEGIEAGEKIGFEKGVEIGEKIIAHTLLSRQLYKKYQIDAADWLSTLTVDQLDEVSEYILECSTFDELKEKVRK